MGAFSMVAKILASFLCTAGLLCESVIAKAYIPESSEQVLYAVTNNKDSARIIQLKKLLKKDRRKLTASPKNLKTVVNVATHLVTLAQETQQTKYYDYALTLINKYRSRKDLTTDFLVLSAHINQYDHNFDVAINDLHKVLSTQKDHVQANFTLSAILTLRGNYSASNKHCKKLASASRLILSAVCSANNIAMTGQLKRAYSITSSLYRLDHKNSDSVKQWMLLSLTDMAVRLGYNDQATKYFKDGLRKYPDNVPLQVAYTDFLIETDKSPTVVKLLDRKNLDTLLLLRLVRAQQIANPSATLTQSKLVDSIFESKFRKTDYTESSKHAREFAYYHLYIKKNPKLALHYALHNWRQQKEPIDYLLLARAAGEANNRRALKVVLSWIDNTNVGDIRLNVYTQ